MNRLEANAMERRGEAEWQGLNNLETLLSQVKPFWITVISLATWAVSLYLGFIGTPPPDDAGNPEDLTGVSRIVIAVFFVLWGSLALAFSRRNHIWIWRSILLLALLLTLVGWGGYRRISHRLICDMEDGKYFVRGDTFTPVATDYIEQQRNDGRRDQITCQELIEASLESPDQIWPEQEIAQNRNTLIALFLSIIPAFVLTLTSSAQLLICHKSSDVYSDFTGNWQDGLKSPEVQLQLIALGRKVSGKITFYSALGTPKIESISPENARFKCSALHLNLTRSSGRYVMRVSTDVRKAQLHRKDGETGSWQLMKNENKAAGSPTGNV